MDQSCVALDDWAATPPLRCPQIVTESWGHTLGPKAKVTVRPRFEETSVINRGVPEPATLGATVQLSKLAHRARVRGKTGEDIARASPILVQCDCCRMRAHPEGQQRISNVRPISPQRFAARFEAR